MVTPAALTPADYAAEDRWFSPPTICRYLCACGRIDFGAFDGVIFTHCCSSGERLYDYVQYRYPHVFTHMLELPSRQDAAGTALLQQQYAALFDALRVRFSLCDPQPLPLDEAAPAKTVWVVGGGVHPAWLSAATALLGNVTLQAGDCLNARYGDRFLQEPSTPDACPHMQEYLSWFAQRLQRSRGEIAAVMAVHSPQCDYALFTLPLIREICHQQACPFLSLEEEWSPVISEHNRIRLEAFGESQLKKRKLSYGQPH